MSIPELKVAAPGKLNLVLHLGPTRPDGLHELASFFDSVTLADELTLRAAEGDGDVVVCPGVEGENLVATTLRAARETGQLTGPPLEISIDKRVPVAAGMGGGSGDAAAALRLVAAISGSPISEFEELAFSLGADVPSQLKPGAALVHGAGERVTPIAPTSLTGAADRAYVIVEQRDGLSTAEVFRQADRSELPEPEIVGREEALLEAVTSGVDTQQLCDLVENALAPAIVALRPELAHLPQTIVEHGALTAAFTGSGPTSFGIFDGIAAAEGAAEALRAAGHLAHASAPVNPAFSEPRPLETVE